MYQKANQTSQLTWVDRKGVTLSTAGEPGQWGTIAVDKDEKRAVLVNRETSDLWLMDFARRIKSRFTTGEANDVNPLWTPDGGSVVWLAVGEASNTYVKKADGSGSPQLITKSGQPLDFSPDGKVFLFSRQGLLWTSSWQGDKKETQVRKVEFNESSGKFSADGKWLAYGSDESGRYEVYVQPFPPTGARTQVSSNGGTHPQWRSDGR